MKPIHSPLPASLLAAACFLAASPGQALAFSGPTPTPTPTPVGPTLSNCTTLAGTNGLVTVTECAFSGGSGPISHGGTYGISVASGNTPEITQFFVSTNNPYGYSGFPNDTSFEYAPFAQRSVWGVGYVSASGWNTGVQKRIFGQAFEDLFGSDKGAYYFNARREVKGGPLLNPLQAGETVSPESLTFGWYGGAPNSHFVAFNGTSIVSQSFTSPVPEPSAYALMLAGLGALGVMVRRRRTA